MGHAFTTFGQSEKRPSLQQPPYQLERVPVWRKLAKKRRKRKKRGGNESFMAFISMLCHWIRLLIITDLPNLILIQICETLILK